jgi:hypothetical protein
MSSTKYSTCPATSASISNNPGILTSKWLNSRILWGQWRTRCHEQWHLLPLVTRTMGTIRQRSASRRLSYLLSLTMAHPLNELCSFPRLCILSKTLGSFPLRIAYSLSLRTPTARAKSGSRKRRNQHRLVKNVSAKQLKPGIRMAIKKCFWILSRNY